ncbi:MAG: efflux RND transporter permease subunit [Pseudobdellovibrionaceae bacterium]
MKTNWNKYIIRLCIRAWELIGINFWISLILAAAGMVGVLSLKPEFSHRAWYHQNHPNIAAYNNFEKEFGNEDTILIGLLREKGISDSSFLATVKNLTQDLEMLPTVDRVESLSTFPVIRSDQKKITIRPILKEKTGTGLSEKERNALQNELMYDPLLRDYLVNKEGTLTLIHVRIEPHFEHQPNYHIIMQALNQTLERYKNRDITFFVSGTVAGIDSILKVVQADLLKIVPALLLSIFFLFWFFYRRWSICFLSIATLVCSILVTLGIASIIGITYNPVTSMLPQILIAVSLADLIHLFSGYQSYSVRSISIKTAIIRTFQRKLIPTLMTSLTASIGFLGLTLTDLKPVRELGLLGAIGIAIAWIMTYLIVPYFLKVFHVRIDSVSSFNIMVPKDLLVRFLKTLDKHKWSNFIGIIFITVIFGIAAKNLPVDVSTTAMLPYTHPIREADRILENRFGSSNGIEVLVNSENEDGITDPIFLRKIETLEKWILTLKDVHHAMSINLILKTIHQATHYGLDNEFRIPNRAVDVAQSLLLYEISSTDPMGLNRWVTRDRKSALIRVLWRVNGTNRGAEIMNQIELKAASLGLNAKVTGKFRLTSGTNQELVSTFFQSIVGDLLLLSILLILISKKISLGIISLVPNFVPALSGAFLMWVLNMPLNFGTVLVASVCLGIAIDDTVHFIYAFIESKQSTIFDKTVDGLLKAGPAVLTTSLVMIFSFGLFMLGDLRLNFEFGLIVSVIMTAAAVCEFWILPTLLFIVKGNKS